MKKLLLPQMNFKYALSVHFVKKESFGVVIQKPEYQFGFVVNISLCIEFAYLLNFTSLH